MLAVNLLPWRTQQWQRRRQQSVFMLACTLALTVMIVLMLWWQANEAQRLQEAQLKDARQQRDGLQQQLAAQHALIQQRDDLLRVQWVRQQQWAEHRRWQQFWQQLPTLMPDTLWLNRVERRKGLLRFEGQAQSMLAVRDFRQQLLTQPLLAKVKPGTVQRQADGQYRFALHAQLQEVTHE